MVGWEHFFLRRKKIVSGFLCARLLDFSPLCAHSSSYSAIIDMVTFEI
jgi:hypothetical protein